MSDPTSIPEGFDPLRIGGEFMSLNGPIYTKREGERLLVGFRVEARHCNPMKMCHGGMLASFADMLLPVSAHAQSAAVANRFLPTINLQIDYLAPAPLGAWVEGEGQLLRETRSLVFVQAVARADGVACLRASGIFKIGPEAPWRYGPAPSTG
jgi:uncharacterized protein (TIGR00369 family)